MIPVLSKYIRKQVRTSILFVSSTTAIRVVYGKNWSGKESTPKKISVARKLMGLEIHINIAGTRISSSIKMTRKVNWITYMSATNTRVCLLKSTMSTNVTRKILEILGI
jgi:hypothetical protein